MPVIPGINKDLSLISKDINDKIHEPKHQRNLVLIIVCIALLLDNMLYMVIVPIIPDYLEKLDMEANSDQKFVTSTLAALSINNNIPPYIPSKLEQDASKDNKQSSASKLVDVLASNDSKSKGIGVTGDDDDDDDDDDDEKTTTTSTFKTPKGRVMHKTTTTKQSTTTETTTMGPDLSKSTDENKNKNSNDVAVGFLFASKAIVQLIINPFSGAFIDRIGYDVPMCIGLTVIFLSTLTFSFGNSYSVLFLARSLQGLGSAFADTGGLAMIADRFTEEGERSKALGIALAFISFGSLVAPPFGGVLYEYLGKQVPFILLAFLALFDGCMLLLVMRPHRIAMTLQQNHEYKPKGTPIWRLFRDPYIAVCSGALVMANVSLAFLEPTIAFWMEKTMNASESQIGSVWLPGFVPHLLGVLFTVWMSKRFPQYQWVLAAGGLALEGVSCFIIPFCTNFYTIMLPISGICFGIALVDTAILPTLAYLVDVRHTSVYGSIYAIADISYSLAYAFGPIMAGNIVHGFGFTALNMGICFSTLAYTPALFFLRYFYEFKPLESNELSAISNAQSAVGGAGFKRFINDTPGNDFNNEFTSLDTGMSLNPNTAALNSSYQNQVNKPQSAVFQSMQKYPKKQSKNPYKDTHNLIDDMDEDEN